MKVVIIEDETPALEKLERYLAKYDASYEVVGRLSSIFDATIWFKDTSNVYDVVFMDIQLTDGLCFDIFTNVSINKPIIFITAFDEYAIDAFKVNSVDYILKPITFTDLSKALNKLKSLQSVFSMDTAITEVAKQVTKGKIKDRFLVRLGNHIHSIKTDVISLFYAEGRTVYLVTTEGKKFILDFNLEQLNDLLDRSLFFRVNRTFIININTIADVVMYSNSRLKISSKVATDKEIVVSRERVTAFKNWFEGN